MFGDVIVPLDGSDESARALGPASALAHYLDSTLRVVAFHRPGEAEWLAERVDGQMEQCGDVQRIIRVEAPTMSVAEHVLHEVEEAPSSLVCMSSHGHGRSAAVIGSVATEVLRGSSGPVLVLGPHYESQRFRLHGPLHVCVDGSDHATAILPVAEAFSIVFDFEPEVVSVVSPEAVRAFERSRSAAPGSDVGTESGYVHHLAAGMEEAVGAPVTYTVLHSDKPADEIVRHAAESHAALIAMATHGASGLKRLVSGSVMSDVLRHAPCPVLALRPPTLS